MPQPTSLNRPFLVTCPPKPHRGYHASALYRLSVLLPGLKLLVRSPVGYGLLAYDSDCMMGDMKSVDVILIIQVVYQSRNQHFYFYPESPTERISCRDGHLPPKGVRIVCYTTHHFLGQVLVAAPMAPGASVPRTRSSSVTRVTKREIDGFEELQAQRPIRTPEQFISPSTSHVTPAKASATRPAALTVSHWCHDDLPQQGMNPICRRGTTRNFLLTPRALHCALRNGECTLSHMQYVLRHGSSTRMGLNGGRELFLWFLAGAELLVEASLIWAERRR